MTPDDIGLDTNILLAPTRTSEPQSTQAANALARLRGRGHRLVLVPYVIAEYWSVCTRPATSRGGLGIPAVKVGRMVEALESEFDLLPDRPEVYGLWKDLVTRYGVVGASVHDARLVACLLAHGVNRLLSFDHGGFARYAEIEAVDPASFAK